MFAFGSWMIQICKNVYDIQYKKLLTDNQ